MQPPRSRLPDGSDGRRRRGARRAAVAGVLIAACLAGPVLPRVADAETRAVYDRLEIREREAHLLEGAAELGEQLARRGYLHEGSTLDELVKRIGGELAPTPTDPYVDYRFRVVRNPLPGAFAFPDGQVFVHTGMLAVLENEAQLATLLAHEIHHTAGHHAILRFRHSRKRLVAGSLFEGAGSRLGMRLGSGSGSGSPGVTVSIDLGSLLHSIIGRSADGYGMALEEEADWRAVETVAEAGYDVRESARLFEVLAREAQKEPFDLESEWGSHRELAERASYLRQFASLLGESLDLDTLEAGIEAYRSPRRDVALETVEHLIHEGFPQAAAAMAEWLVEGDANDAGARYVLAESLRALWAAGGVSNERYGAALPGARRQGPTEAETLDSARREYELSLELEPGMASAHRGLGLVLYEQGLSERSGRELLSYLRSRPQAEDRPAILKMIHTITADLRSTQGEHRNGDTKKK